MDFTLLLGWVLGFVLVGFGILQGGKIGGFIDPASVAITIGGSISGMLASFPLSAWTRIPSHFKIIFGKNKYDPMKYINIITELSQEARRKGLLALEDKILEYNDPFLKDAVMLIVDAVEPAKVQAMLEGELTYLEERHQAAWRFYDRFAAFGPAFGMIGTLIGLVNMLADLDVSSGTQKLGLNMSVALITTFYGSMLQNVIFTPVSVKLREKHNEEINCKSIIVEGVISIQAGENPRHIHDKLMTTMTRQQRIKEEAKEKAGKSSE